MSMPLNVVAVVDDDQHALKGIARLLSSYGFRVLTFSSAEQFLDAPETHEASCVILDINLGEGISGLDVGRMLSASTRPIPIIFMTGSADLATRDEARALDCVAFLEKPFPCELLVDAILKSRMSGS